MGWSLPYRGPGRQYRFSFQDLACARLQALLRPTSRRRVALTLRDERGLGERPPGNTSSISTSRHLADRNARRLRRCCEILEGESLRRTGYAVEEHAPDDIARLDWGQQLREEGLVEAAEAIYRGGLQATATARPSCCSASVSCWSSPAASSKRSTSTSGRSRRRPTIRTSTSICARVYQQLGMSRARRSALGSLSRAEPDGLISGRGFDSQQRAVVFIREHVEQSIRALTHVANALMQIRQQAFRDEALRACRSRRRARARRCAALHPVARCPRTDCPSTAGTDRRCRTKGPDGPIDGSHRISGSSTPGATTRLASCAGPRSSRPNVTFGQP